VIRRWHGRERWSIREISGRPGLSRNTIRKYLSNGELEPKYPPRQSANKLDRYAAMLASRRAREAMRSRKQRRKSTGPTSGSPRLPVTGGSRNAKANPASRGAYVPLAFAPGEVIG
jgi:hypothetical protein